MSKQAPYTQVRFDGSPDEVNAQWERARRGGIGGSDVAAIMGISKFRSPYEVWLDKTGRVEPQDISGKQAVEWGNRLEDTVARKFADDHPELSVKRRNAMLVSKSRPWAFANLDRVATDENGNHYVLECKTAGERRKHDWDDGVPDYYQTQVVHYLGVTGFSGAWVAVLIGGQDYREFYIPRDEEDIAVISEIVDAFWHDRVEGDQMPPMVGLESESQALAGVYGDWRDEYANAADEDLISADCDIETLADVKRKIEELTKEKRRIEDCLKSRIGDRKGIMTQTNRVTWARSDYDRFDSKRFKEEQPELFARYTVRAKRDGGLRIASRKG